MGQDSALLAGGIPPSGSTAWRPDGRSYAPSWRRYLSNTPGVTRSWTGSLSEMAAKGEAGCGLVADPALHEKMIAAMIAHLRAKSSETGEGAVDPGQPFRLRLIAALLRDASDPDWKVFLEAIEGLPADFWAKYGDEAAVSAIAVIVEEGRALELLLYADDVEIIGGDRRGRRGIVLSYAILACLGFPFKWSKTKGGLNVQWVGYETAYGTFKLGISERRAAWLAEWTSRISAEGKVTWDDFACGLGRLGFGANALSWERPFLGPLYAWSAATRGRRGALQLPVMLRSILAWMSGRFSSGDRLQSPVEIPMGPKAGELSFFSDAKAEEGSAWVGGYLWDGDSALQWYALEVLESWAPWAFIKKDLKRTIASLELLGTLICVKLWGDRMKRHGK
ncbi:unnamed protein product, partial [Symbiodinium sp. CCMP2456]